MAIMHLNANDIVYDLQHAIGSNKIVGISDIDKENMNLCARILNEILTDEEDFQIVCASNWDTEVSAIHSHIKSIINDRVTDKSAEIRRLSFVLFRLVYERRARTRKIGGENGQDIIEKYLGSSKISSDDEKARIHFWAFNLQRDILNQDHNSLINTANKLRDSANECRDDLLDKVKNCNDKIKSISDAITECDEKVKNVSQQLNFVTLAKSFRQLVRERKTELRRVTRNLLIMGVVVLLPLLISVAITLYIWHTSDTSEAALKNKLLFSIPVLIPIEIVLVYFFRIVLKEQLSLKAQILQLELRYSVCAFIEGYVDFAKKAGDAKLDKFEALVFSGITPDPSAVPGTFDGMDQLLNLAKAAGGK